MGKMNMVFSIKLKAIIIGLLRAVSGETASLLDGATCDHTNDYRSYSCDKAIDPTLLMAMAHTRYSPVLSYTLATESTI